MFPPSRSLAPRLVVAVALSDPAKSTNVSLERVSYITTNALKFFME